MPELTEVIHNTDILRMGMKEMSTIVLVWQNDCLSNLAISYGLCTLDSTFLH